MRSQPTHIHLNLFFEAGTFSTGKFSRTKTTAFFGGVLIIDNVSGLCCLLCLLLLACCVCWCLLFSVVCVGLVYYFLVVTYLEYTTVHNHSTVNNTVVITVGISVLAS